MSHSTIVVRVENELKSAFADAAKAADRTTSQLLRDYMRDYVECQVDAAAHDTWFRRQVAKGLEDARAGRVKPSDKVEAHFAERRAATLRTLAGRRGET